MPQVLGASEVPETQDSVALGGNENWDVIPSMEGGSTPGGSLTFQAPTSIGMTDVAASYIVLKGYYALTADVAGGGPNANVTVPQFLAACALNSVEIDVNGTIIVPSQGPATPYAMVANIIKNESFADRESGDMSMGYILDTFDQGDNVDLGANLQGAVRRDRFMAATAVNAPAKPFSLTYRLADAGFRTKSWLPPGVSISVRARRSETAFMRQGTAAQITAAAPIFTLNSAKLYLSRKILKEHAMRSLRESWAITKIKVPYERVRASISWAPAASSSISVIGALAGPTPSCVFAFPVRQAAITGNSNGEQPSMVLRQQDGSVWASASLSIGGGRTYPLQPLVTTRSTRTNTTEDFSEMYQMYRSCCNDMPFLHSSDFSNIQPLCFQIGTRSKNGWDETEDVSIGFEGTLSAAQNDAWALILVSFTEAVAEIDHTGRVEVF